MSEQTQTVEEPKHAGGVKTSEGKAVSRYNAQKHAILRETITEYEKSDAEQFYNELADAIKPTGRLQELLVETVASNAVRLLRIAKAEAEFIKQTLHPLLPDLPPVGRSYNPKVNSGAIERLELYSLYQTATENRMHRSIALLRALQSYGNTTE